MFTPALSNVRIVISSNPDNLRAALQGQVAAVVEAEYGKDEVRGSSDLLTLNHHIRPERPCPCSLNNEHFAGVRDSIKLIGISHVDLDTLGGIAALMGVKIESTLFWRLAEYVDLNGPHRITASPDYNKEAHYKLASFWAWSQENRLHAPRDGSVADCTEYVVEALKEVGAILTGAAGTRTRGVNFLTEENAAAAFTLVKEGRSKSGQRVVLRRHDAFVNHLYYGEDGGLADIVVGYNTRFGGVTVSRATDNVPLMARDLVQSLWGDLAGGHPGIAGSPRGEELDFSEAERAFEAILAM